MTMADFLNAHFKEITDGAAFVSILFYSAVIFYLMSRR